jgi:hypothetical protein
MLPSEWRALLAALEEHSAPGQTVVWFDLDRSEGRHVGDTSARRDSGLAGLARRRLIGNRAGRAGAAGLKAQDGRARTP